MLEVSDSVCRCNRVPQGKWSGSGTSTGHMRDFIKRQTMPLGDYVTTEDSCSCPAFQYRPGPCKHIDQVREVTEHLKQQGEIVKVSPRTLPDGSWGVAVNGGRVQVGQTVTVESNNGKTWSAVITQIAEDHPTHQLCATCKPEEWTGAPPAPAQAAPAPAPAQTTEAPLYPPETPAQARQPQRPKGGDKPDRAAPGEDQVWDPVPEVQKNMVYGYRWGYWAGRRDGLTPARRVCATTCSTC